MLSLSSIHFSFVWHIGWFIRSYDPSRSGCCAKNLYPDVCHIFWEQLSLSFVSTPYITNISGVLRSLWNEPCCIEDTRDKHSPVLFTVHENAELAHRVCTAPWKPQKPLNLWMQFSSSQKPWNFKFLETLELCGYSQQHFFCLHMLHMAHGAHGHTEVVYVMPGKCNLQRLCLTLWENVWYFVCGRVGDRKTISVLRSTVVTWRRQWIGPWVTGRHAQVVSWQAGVRRLTMHARYTSS